MLSSNTVPDASTTNSCEDITVGLLDYDWRTATNHPQAHLYRAAKSQATTKESTIENQRPIVQPVRQVSEPLTESTAEKPRSPELRQSACGPGLVPKFFGSHLAPRASVHSSNVISSLKHPTRISPSSSVYAPQTPTTRAPAVLSMGAPLPVVPANLQKTLPQTSAAPVFDPAANLLSILQNKLEGIQAAVKTSPRTGFSQKTLHSFSGAPVLGAMPCKPEPDNLDEDFVALVSCQPPVRMAPTLGKRKAGSDLEVLVADLDAKTEDLKARNRASAKLSRERKKAHLENLHKQIDQLTKQNLELAQTCQDVAEDNRKLREELTSLGYKGEKLSDIVVTEAKRLIHSLALFSVAILHACVHCCGCSKGLGPLLLCTTCGFYDRKIPRSAHWGFPRSFQDISENRTSAFLNIHPPLSLHHHEHDHRCTIPPHDHVTITILLFSNHMLRLITYESICTCLTCFHSGRAEVAEVAEVAPPTA